MARDDKTVFISYRRSVSAFIARSIYQDLRYNGYDVFMDVASIDSGAFDTAILNQIAARAHFVVILTPGAVERCVNEDGSPNSHDWFRHEIEHAINLERNVVPLLINNFSFQENERYLTCKLAELSRFNALNVPHDYFEEAMERLRNRFLKQKSKGRIIEPPDSDLPVIKNKMVQAANQPTPTKEQLTAEQYLQRAHTKVKGKDFDAAIADYEQVIRLDPVNALAFLNRGILFLHEKKYVDAATMDFSETVRLEPMMVEAYFERAFAFYDKKNWEEAIANYTEVIRQDVFVATALNNRGEAYFMLHEYDKALKDFTEANKLKHDGFRMSIAGIAISHHALGNIEKAKQHWQSLIKRSLKFKDIEWIKKELNWDDKLVEEARKIISLL